MENESNTQQTPNETYNDLEENVTWDDIETECYEFISIKSKMPLHVSLIFEFLKQNFKPPERK